MRKKVIFLLFLGLFSISSFAINQSGICCGQNTCTFNGILDNSSRREEEFSYLFDAKDSPNHRTIAYVVGILIIDPTIENENCKVHEYIKGLLRFYETNKEKIEIIDPEIVELLEFIKKRLEKH